MGILDTLLGDEEDIEKELEKEKVLREKREQERKDRKRERERQRRKKQEVRGKKKKALKLKGERVLEKTGIGKAARAGKSAKKKASSAVELGEEIAGKLEDLGGEAADAAGLEPLDPEEAEEMKDRIF